MINPQWPTLMAEPNLRSIAAHPARAISPPSVFPFPPPPNMSLWIRWPEQSTARRLPDGSIAASTSTMRLPLHTALHSLPMLTCPGNEVGPSPRCCRAELAKPPFHSSRPRRLYPASRDNAWAAPLRSRYDIAGGIRPDAYGSTWLSSNLVS